MSRGKIIITPRTFARRGQKQIKRLEKVGFEVVINDTGSAFSYEDLLSISREATGIIVGTDRIDENFLRACPKLKTVAKYGVGIDNINVEVANELGISITRTVGSNSNAVAEYAISLMLASAKNIVNDAMNIKQGNWDLKYERQYGFELTNKTLGLVGFGSIGKRVAKLVSGFEMDVLVYDQFQISDEDIERYNVKVVDFETLIKNSDVISLHIPFSESTKNLFNYEVLRNMKKGSVLVNTARGGIVDENDLLKLLESEHLFAAGFDVYSEEPPLVVDKLMSHENFILTPHTASKTFESDSNTMRMAVDNILESLND